MDDTRWLRMALTCMICGVVLRQLGGGHWTDFTVGRPGPRHVAVSVLGWVMIAYGFLFLLSMVMPPGWALLLIFTIACTYLFLGG